MLPPEIQRIVLLIGLAATSYLLILAWNEDMQADRSPISYSDAPLVADQQTNAIDTSAIRPGVVDQFQSESDIPEEWYEVCEEDMGNDVESDILYRGDRCAGDEDRREQVKHTLIELFNAAPL